MVQISIKGKYFNCVHVWFSDVESPTIFREDLRYYYGTRKLHCKLNKYQIQKSLISVLDEEETLFSLINKTVRYEINKSAKENTVTRVYQPDKINEELLLQFSYCYEQMYKSKGIDAKLNLPELKAYAEQKALTITTAENNGDTLVYHSYVFDNINSRLLHSCSIYRDQDNNMRNLIGRANKYLHWKDMLHFKSIGIRQYDWGGVSSFDKPNGIDMFKMAFGGQRVQYYNEQVPCSPRGIIYHLITKIVK